MRMRQVWHAVLQMPDIPKASPSNTNSRCWCRRCRRCHAQAPSMVQPCSSGAKAASGMGRCPLYDITSSTSYISAGRLARLWGGQGGEEDSCDAGREEAGC